MNETARLIALAEPHLHEETYPSEVVERVIAGEVALKVFREWRGLSQAELGAKAKTVRRVVDALRQKLEP
jgi:hypothetical protein